MKKVILVIIFSIALYPMSVHAGRGCCSHHGGVAGCSSNGRQICNDGTLSPTCTCTPTVKYIYGCTDSSAKNYNPKANKNDGSCKYYKYGCTDKEAKNYDKTAEKDNGKCEYYIYGCTDSSAKNYNSKADKDDGTCNYETKTDLDSKDVTDDSKSYIVTEYVSDESSGFGTILTLGTIGAGTYYLKKKKK